MSNIKLDLSKFKHVSSNDKTTKLRHSDGHFLVLTHGALNPDNQKALSALSNGKEYQTSNQAQEAQDQKPKLADGGKVKIPPQQDPAPKAEPKDRDKEMMNNAGSGASSVSDAINKLAHPWADGGQVQRYPEGGEVKPEDETTLQRYTRYTKEFPGDVAHAFSPEGLSNSASILYNSAKDGLTGNLPEQPQQKAKGGQVRKMYADPQEPVSQKDAAPLKSQEEYAKIIHAKDNQGGGKDYSFEADPGGAQKPEPQAPVQNVPIPAATTTNEQALISKQPEITDDRKQIQKLYNSIVSGNPNNSPFQENTRPWATFGADGEAPRSFDANSWAQAEEQFTQQKASANNVNQSKIAEIQAENKIRARAGLLPIEVPGSQLPPPGQQSTSETTAPTQSAQPQDDISKSMSTQQDLLTDAMKNELTGTEKLGDIESALATKETDIRGTQDKALKAAQELYTTRYNKLEKERTDHLGDINNMHIDPDLYWKDHSKIASAIGMIIAGFNPTTKPNAAVDFLKYQMDRNIDAQKANLQSKHNLLAANLKQFGNAKDAIDMTRLMQSDVIVNSLSKAAAEARADSAKQAALIAKGKIQREFAPLQMDMAIRQSFNHLAQNPSADPNIDIMAANHMVNAYRGLGQLDRAKEMESRIVPGVGVSTMSVSPDIRKELIGHQKLDVALKDLSNFVNTHTTLIPGTPDYVTGAQKSLDVQTLLRESKLNTVYREGEQPLLDKFIKSNPAGIMKNLVTIPQLKELYNSNIRASNILKEANGLRPSIIQQAHPYEGKTASDENGNNIKMINGRWVPIGQ